MRLIRKRTETLYRILLGIINSYIGIMKSQQETSSDYGLVQSDENVEFRTQNGTETSSLAIVEIVLRVSAAVS